MSRIITNTNIIVDDFDFSKSFPKGTFIHFLTHFHSDHYEGLSPLWDYGDIHCTHQTKKFIMNKYPKLQNVYSYDYYAPAQLELGCGEKEGGRLKVTFCLFDAKHIPGSAMVFFQGFMGNILFTGDFRYSFAMLEENRLFFPIQKRLGHSKQQIVQKMEGISLHVDQMIFDNTYCNKAFAFQTQDYITQKMIKIVSENPDKKLILIAMGALGKHKIILRLAQHFQTNIIVSPSQFQKVQVAGLRTDFLTTDPEQGYIHLISKKHRAETIEQTKKGPFSKSFICIDTDFLMLQHQSPDQINYIVPYSLHSNYQQMRTLVRMVRPAVLRKLVIPFSNFRQVKLRIKIDHRLKFARYLDFIETKLGKSQSGYADLVRHHTAVYQLSQAFLRWFSPKNQQYLMETFGLGDGEQNHNLRKRKPKLLDEQQWSFKSSSNSRSLRNIADSLNAVNRNLTLQKCIQEGVQKKVNQKMQVKFNQFYEQSQRSHHSVQEQKQFDQITCPQPSTQTQNRMA